MAGHSASEDARERAMSAAIHVFARPEKGRRGCPAQGRAWRSPCLWLRRNYYIDYILSSHYKIRIAARYGHCARNGHRARRAVMGCLTLWDASTRHGSYEPRTRWALLRPLPLRERAARCCRAMVGWGVCSNPSPIRDRGQTIVPSPARTRACPSSHFTLAEVG